MLIALIIGSIIGFILAIPPGPVAVTAMRLGLDKGAKHGMLAAMGTGFMDAIYCTMAMFTTSAILNLITNVISSHPLVLLIFQLIVIVSVIVFGIIQFNIKDKTLKPIGPPITRRAKLIDDLSHKGPFLLGIAISLANIASPTFLPSLAYLTMNVHAIGLIQKTSLNNILFSLGFGIGNFAWLYTLVRVLVHYKSRMSPQFLSRIHQFAGFTLIGFGTILGYRVITVTHWPEVLGLLFAF